MNRNNMVITIGVIGVLAGVLGFWLYEQQRRPGVDISIGGHGVSIRER